MLKVILSFILLNISTIVNAAPIVDNWNTIQEVFFKGRNVNHTNQKILIHSPIQAEDASLIPFAFKVNLSPNTIRKVYIFADANPILLTATFTPAAAQQIEAATRIRLENNSLVRVIAENMDGELWMSSAVIKTPGGGCAGGGYSDEAQLRASAGEIKFKLKATELALNIRHPMRTGFERTPQGYYAKAWHLNYLQLRAADYEIMSIDIGPGISANPYFLLNVPLTHQDVMLTVKDNEGKVYEKRLTTD